MPKCPRVMSREASQGAKSSAGHARVWMCRQTHGPPQPQGLRTQVHQALPVQQHISRGMCYCRLQARGMLFVLKSIKTKVTEENQSHLPAQECSSHVMPELLRCTLSSSKLRTASRDHTSSRTCPALTPLTATPTSPPSANEHRRHK